ncbi:MAG TPA: sulfatase-like hydrolase/transferase [Acidobacteriaceae bacterium]|nr:sulfatase-like hydrolase/transferase [Acidobacteriaceae bacterium]
MKPTNIVLVTLDTVRADHLHCYGNAKIKTPTIDALAGSGVLFEKAVAQAPLTLPSHASMFTGTNPNVHHVRDTGGFVLQPSSVTMATILRQHGWNTAAFVGAIVFKRVFGFNQGFSVYDDRMPGSSSGEGMMRNAGVTVDHALAWLNAQPEQPDKPFFVWLHFYDAHQPYIPPPAEFQRQYPGDTYDAEIAYMDQQLGRFVNAVKKRSPAQNTLFIVLSDHGESLGDHGEYEHGVFLYDSTVRIAWLMAGPGIPAGVRVWQQARTIDLLPTVLDLLGGHASPAVQGTSLVPAFVGKPVATEYSYEETMYPKFIMNWAPLRGIHTAEWMYVRAPKPELYDLKTDPAELHNVIDAHPKKYRELDEQLKLLIGNNGTETVVSQQMDEQTMQKLRSLGYLGGSSQQSASLDSAGADPKDQVEILKLLHQAKDTPAGEMSSSRRVELYREALKKDPSNPALYYALGDEYQNMGQNEANLQLCLDALHHGVSGPMILSRLGHLYLSKGNAQQAIAYYEPAVKMDPTDVGTIDGLAAAYSANGQLAEATTEFQRALAIEPYIPAYNGLGLVAVKQHDFITARQNFERAIQIDPKDAESQLNLGVLCMQTGDASCGRTAFHAFLANASPVQYRDMIPRVQYALRTVLAPKP